MRWIKKGIAAIMLLCLLADIGTQPKIDVLAAEKPPAKTYTYKIRTLTARRGKKKIFGKIFIPVSSNSKKKKFPTVIFSHGFGGNYEVGEPYAKALARKGYAVYCFDFCGGSPDSRSSGSTLDMSIFTEQKDLEAVLRKIKKQSYVDRENIFLFGTSQGGVVSAITAAEHEKEIRGLILFYPAFVLVDDAKKTYASATLKVIKRAGHGFDGKDEDRAIRYMLSYLEKQRK